MIILRYVIFQLVHAKQEGFEKINLTSENIFLKSALIYTQRKCEFKLKFLIKKCFPTQFSPSRGLINGFTESRLFILHPEQKFSDSNIRKNCERNHVSLFFK